MSNRGFSARALIATVVVAGFILVGAAMSRSRDHAPLARPTPSGQFTSRIEQVSRQTVIAYANTLVFDTSYHASDSRRLVERHDGQLVDGPFATISPEIGARSISWAQLDSGRILARVTTDAPMASHGYAKGVNYIWVENRNGHLHGVVIPADSSAPEHSFRMSIVHTNMGDGRPAEARFRWNDLAGENLTWFGCAFGCCTADPPDGHQEHKSVNP